MSVYLSLHIGQSGVQMGNACWELYCLEHGISVDGFYQKYINPYKSIYINRNDQIQIKKKTNEVVPFGRDNDTSYSTIFHRLSTGKFMPRCLFIDTEATVIDEVRTGSYRQLFHPDQLISGNEDAANNYARGYNKVSPALLANYALDEIRRSVELSDWGLSSFLTFHSYGGGTGSGLTSRLMKCLRQDYPKISQLHLSIYPSPKICTCVVEPYNCLLLNNSIQNTADCNFIIDNEAIYQLCFIKLDIDFPTYTNINRLLSQVVSSMTVSLRFENELSMDLSEIRTNLVPYPRLHFPVVSFAPIVSPEKTQHEPMCEAVLTRACFSGKNQLIRCNLSPHDSGTGDGSDDATSGRYISCCLMYRGDIDGCKVSAALGEMRAHGMMQFVDWCPTGFKIGINYQPPLIVPTGEMGNITRSLLMLANNTAIASAWTRIGSKFDKLFKRRAFIHWFTSNGLEEDELVQSRISSSQLELDYREVERTTDGDIQAIESNMDSANIKQSVSDHTSSQPDKISQTTKVDKTQLPIQTPNKSPRRKL